MALRLPTREACSGIHEALLSLTVAGAVEELHLFPEHPGASRYHNRMKPVFFLFVLLLHASTASALAVRDDYGNEVRLAVPAKRIVSLSPHLTEILYAAGAGGRTVGAADYSDFPVEAKSLPRVGGAAGIDLEAVLALHPDLVVAWPNAGTLKAIDRLAALKLPVFRSEPRALEDIASTLERLGTLAETSETAAPAAAAFRARVASIERRYAKRPAVRVFYQVWDRPIITVNGQHVISKVMRLCGGENVFADLPLIAPEIGREALIRANPEVIIASGSDTAPPVWLERWKAFPEVKAVAAGHLYVIAPELIQRHAPRLLDGAERLCSLLEQVRMAR
jgi:iron complex transport system substrate-binding protein